MKKNSKDCLPLQVARGGAKPVIIGIDLGDKQSQYCVLNGKGEVTEEGALRTTPEGFRQWLKGRKPCRIVVEAGGHSPWVSRLLETEGYPVLVANPCRLPMIYASQNKNDRMDARKLAQLARVDASLLAPIRHRSAQAQADLSVIRARESLVEARTKLINAVRGLVKTSGARVKKCASRSFPKQAAGQVPEILRPAVEPLLETIEGLSEQIKHYDQLLEEMAERRYPETELMTQVPGVGTLTALTFRLTLDDAERFRRSRDVGGYLGLRPRQQDSGEQTPQLRITKAGDRYLRSTLVNCAHHILGPFGADTDLRRWGLKLCARGGKNAKKRAIVAVARKLAVLLHHLWVCAEVYEPLRNQPVESVAA